MLHMKYDVIVIGAGAAGLMAAAQAGKRGRRVLLIEHTNKIGEKIRISGGGRCNFTNINASSQNYISANPSFAISALSRYTQHDFIKLVESYNISYHEKTLGQLFCDGSSMQIIDMLIKECITSGVKILLECQVNKVDIEPFQLETDQGKFVSESLIIASGGLSIPKMGATDFGYQIAKQFGLNIVSTKPALVPLTVADVDVAFFRELSGVSIPSVVSHKKVSFKENILFTHKGLSGPAILQISSYLDDNSVENIDINLLPEVSLKDVLIREKNTKATISNLLKLYLPKRFVENWYEISSQTQRLAEYKSKDLEKIAEDIHKFKVKIIGNAGYDKAEVTAGGVDTKELSSKTMSSIKIPGLFFIGEVVDVTGWLGGYNFQWAWSSGHVAGSYA